MKFTKKDLKPVLVLGAICLVVALLLAGVNMLTSEKIRTDKEAAITKSLEQVMPGVDPEDVTSEYNLTGTTVTTVYRDKGGKGHVVTLSSAKGYTGNAILLTIGIDNEGRVTGAVITSNPESKEPGRTDSYFAGFAGKDAFEIDAISKNEPELVAGVTFSTKAVRLAAYDAFKVLGYDIPELPPVERVENITGWSYAGIAIAVAVIGLAVAYTIVKRRKGI